MERFGGRVAFITGGAQGIGLGIARALAREGVKLALADVNSQALEQARAELSASTPTEAFVLDVRDRDRFASVADEAEQRLGPVSLVFNNAGVAGGAGVDTMTYETWDWILGINVTGVVNGVQTFVPRILSRGGDGYIVNTASGAGLILGSGFMYGASKFAVVGLSEGLRYALKRRNIGVSVLCPGYVSTDIRENSAALNPAEGRAVPTQAPPPGEDLLKDKGMPIDVVGELVLAGMRANQLHIYTDDEIGTHLERRHQLLMAALATAPSRADRP